MCHILPCSVVAHEDDSGNTVITAVDPAAMLDMVKSPRLQSVAQEARARLQQAAESLVRRSPGDPVSSRRSRFQRDTSPPTLES